MKKLSTTLLSLLMLGGFVFMTSCNSDDDNGEPAVEGPSVSFVNEGDQWITDDATVNQDEVVYVTPLTRSGDNPLSQFRVTGGSQGGTLFDTTLDEVNSYEDTFRLNTADAGEHTYTFEIIDSEGEEASKQITITVNETNPLNEYSTVLMGAQTNPNQGSFYSTSENKTYLTGGVNGDNSGNRVKVDFIYFHGSTFGQSIAGPSDTDVEAFSDYNVSDWSAEQRNNTRFLGFGGNFSEVNSTAYFEAGGEGANLRSELQNQNNTKFSDFAEGDAFAFLTDDGRIGICEVASIDNKGTTGSNQARGDDEITINVKVEPN